LKKKTASTRNKTLCGSNIGIISMYKYDDISDNVVVFSGRLLLRGEDYLIIGMHSMK
jgi:hypothetical protein